MKECDLNLGNINVLIGSNDAGKTNYVSMLELLQRISEPDKAITIDAYGHRQHKKDDPLFQKWENQRITARKGVAEMCLAFFLGIAYNAIASYNGNV